MRHSYVLAVLLLSALALVPACEDDPVQPASSSGYLSLTSRGAVLNNIEVAWNQRATNRIDDLLDDNFTFYFAPGDVGGEIPVQWSRTEELAASTALFTSNTMPSNGPVCTSVRVDIVTDNLQWVEIIPQDFPDEIWYATLVFCNFTFKMEPDMIFLSGPGAKAQFTLRNVPEGGEDRWQLIEWRDLGNYLVAGAAQTARSPEKTWGSIKALYR